MHVSRRAFLALVPATALPLTRLSAADVAPAPAPPVSDAFPTQDAGMVREMVGVSHGNVARVKELLAEHRTLANAAWDWGFGDWETALGAASHVGNREIASLLLDHGARPTIFSAAMLGQLEVVRSFVSTSPGVQRTLGPHGITLLAHARAGGEGAKPVHEYLTSLGDADNGYVATLSEERAPRYTGTYVFGSEPSSAIEISFERGGLRFARKGGSPRNLVALEQDAFHPVGAPAVRIRFVGDGERATGLTVHDPGLVLRAVRQT
jgi:ankyrin repeat protein